LTEVDHQQQPSPLRNIVSKSLKAETGVRKSIIIGVEVEVKNQIERTLGKFNSMNKKENKPKQ